MKQKVHLICNAHLDPVWQWEWEEGAAEAVSTFRAAADLCENTDEILFCHNEVILYKWVEEYEPELFRRIQALVKAGKWHVMGGWYLQPDCNMPSGESIIRQMQLGRRYFTEKFGVAPKVAVNFDPFGHSRGLVQILTRAGYTGYLFMRPTAMTLPANDFEWVGFDGSRLLAHRIDTNYNSPLGGAEEKARVWLKEHPDVKLGLLPWGVGNHGGGPSRKDIADLNALKASLEDVEMVHSTPEDFFEDLEAVRGELPVWSDSLRPWAIGCYTSQVRIKQANRRLEGALAVAERMCSHAASLGLMQYPEEELKAAAEDLSFGQFHDILPGSSIQPAEEMGLRLFGHGQEIVSRLRARAFFALASGEKKAAPGEYPVLAYNPHPYEAEGDWSCEFMMADQNWKPEFTIPRVFTEDGVELSGQVEKEESNLTLDWRKRVTFHAKLAPFSVTRFNCRLELHDERPVPECDTDGDDYVFSGTDWTVRIGRKTGLMESYVSAGRELLSAPSCEPLLLFDSSDPWEMNRNSIRNVDAPFRLMTNEECAEFCAVQPGLAPVHVIESGPVRTVIEAIFLCGVSRVVLRYVLSRTASGPEVQVRVLFGEKDKMLKLAVHTAFGSRCLGETMFGTEELFTDGTENVSQRYLAVCGEGLAMTVLNDGTYGSDYLDGELRLSLLRSPGYTAHPILDRELLPQNRFSPRIDQGERCFCFRFAAGEENARLAAVGKEAALFSEQPWLLSFFPNKDVKTVRPPLCTLDNDRVQLTAFRQAADGRGWILRLFSASGKPETAVLRFGGAKNAYPVSLAEFEAATFRWDPEKPLLENANILD